MKKTLKFLSIILVAVLLVGCNKKTSSTEPVKTNEPEVEVSKLKEGKYVQIAPESTPDSQGYGYKVYITLENGNIIEDDTYFGNKVEGTYIVDGDILTIHYTRNHGMTTYGEPFDDQIDRTFTCHIDGNKIIIDKMSDFDAYDTGSIIFELEE